MVPEDKLLVVSELVVREEKEAEPETERVEPEARERVVPEFMVSEVEPVKVKVPEVKESEVSERRNWVESRESRRSALRPEPDPWGVAGALKGVVFFLLLGGVGMPPPPPPKTKFSFLFLKLI